MDDPVEIAEHGAGVAARSTTTASIAGPLTLRRALMRSANAATVRLGESVGERRVAALARRDGHPEPARARCRRSRSARSR